MSDQLDLSAVKWDQLAPAEPAAPAPVVADAPVDLSAVKWDAPAPGAPSANKGGILGGLLMGLRDPIDAGAQLARRAVPDWIGKPVDAFGQYLAQHGFPVTATAGVQGVDDVVRGANANYDASRQLAGRDGIDVARVAGNIANPVNRIVPMAVAGGIPSLVARGMAQGAISGAATPVVHGDEFWMPKAEQVIGGGVAGAVLAPVADVAVKGATDLAMRGVGAIRGASADAVDQAIQSAAKAGQIDLAHISAADMDSLRAQVADALKKGKTLDPAAAVRMAEGEAVLGPDAGLTVGQATRDPKQFTTEKNLRGTDAGEPLMTRYNAQSGALVNALNTAGAAGAPGEHAVGEGLVNALRGVDTGRKSTVTGLYDAARGLNANEVPLDSHAFSEAANKALDSGMQSAFLPAEFKGILNDISSGKTPLTVSVAEQLKTMLASATRSSSDGNIKAALGSMRDALENAPPAVKLGEEATNAFNAARGAHRARMGEIDKNPALAAAVDDVAPDKFFDRFVLRGNARDLQGMVETLTRRTAADEGSNALRLPGAAPTAQEVPPIIADVRKQIVNHLKTKALSGAEDDVGTFSQAGFNKALDRLGDDRLSAFFTPEEIANLHRIGRVASYAQVAPAGSAVNTSNTAAAAYNFLSGLAANLPFVSAINKGVKRASDSLAVGNALSGKVPAQTEEAAVNALRPLYLPLAGAGATASGQLVQ